MISDETVRPFHWAGPGRAAAMTGAYLRAGPLTAREVAVGLPVMLRFRWAVQADYFAWRITAGDLTGITGPEENEKGLEDTRRAPSPATAPSSE
jgi:hypothetical protein